jgi:AraC-like DNA-binding protein/quercetin dioxygenase-like cupin family protein
VPDGSEGHDHDRSEAIVVGRFSLDAGEWFDEHQHDQHQLIWARRGVLGVRIGELRWVLPTTRALWVPAGIPHQTGASTTAEMLSPYLLPERCDVRWTAPTPIAVDELLGPLIAHLTTDLAPRARARAEAVVADLLQPAAATPIRIPMPDDDRARAVAEIIIRNPADSRTLDALARSVGSSRRTVTRRFAEDTGMPFHTWRAQVRIQASVVLLAEGQPVERVSDAVGYAAPSTFSATFRRVLGFTPSEYARGTT